MNPSILGFLVDFIQNALRLFHSAVHSCGAEAFLAAHSNSSSQHEGAMQEGAGCYRERRRLAPARR
jgi:hypothetical protein